MKRRVFILIMSALILLSCTPSKNKNTFEIETKLGTIVNQKWSEYKYKSHFKKIHSRSNVETYLRLVKDENGEYYTFTNDILYVRNDSVIWQGYNKSFDDDEFLRFDSLLLECNPQNVIGDFTPEDKYMKRTYYFNSLYVKIQKSPYNCYIFFYSKDFNL